MLAQPQLAHPDAIWPPLRRRHRGWRSSAAERLPGEGAVGNELAPHPAQRATPRQTPRSSVWRRGWGEGSRFAAAAVLLVIIGAALLASFYPLWPRGEQRLPVFAPVASPEPESVLPDVKSLLTVSIPSFEADQAWLQFGRYQFPPATTLNAELRGGGVPAVFYIEEGTIDARLNVGSFPAGVIRAGGLAPEESLVSGKQASLVAGDAVIVPAESEADLLNLSAAPASVLLIFMPVNADVPQNNAILHEPGGGSTLNLNPPLTLTLELATLPPDASLPGVDDEHAHRIVTPVDPDRVMDARTSSNGALRNAGDELLAAYILTVTSSPGE